MRVTEVVWSTPLGDAMSEETVAALVRSARTRAGLSARELSRRVGRSSGYITQIEAGTRWKRSLPPLAALAEIAAALNVPVDELLPPASRRDYAVARGEAAPRPARRPRGAAAPPRRLAQYHAALDDATQQREYLQRTLTQALRAVGHRALPLLNAEIAQASGSPGEQTVLVSETLVATARRPAAFMIRETLAPWLLYVGDLLLIDRVEPGEWRTRPGQLVVIREDGMLRVRAVAPGDAGRVVLREAEPTAPPIVWREGEDELVGVGIGVIRISARTTPFETPWPGFAWLPAPLGETEGPHSIALGEALTLEIVNASTLFRFDPPEERDRAALPFTTTPVGQVFYDRRLARRRPLMLVPAHRARGAAAPTLFCVGDEDLRGLGIAAGDLLVIDTERTWPRAGDVIAAEYAGRELTRRVAISRGILTLLAQPGIGADPARHAPLVVADPGQLRVIGIAVDALPAPGGAQHTDRGGTGEGGPTRMSDGP